jgi:cytochrome c5
MDTTLVLVLAIAAAVAVVSTLLIRRRQRADAQAAAPGESQFAVSTEGMKICPKCGMGNLWTDRTCISCHAPLKG